MTRTRRFMRFMGFFALGIYALCIIPFYAVEWLGETVYRMGRETDDSDHEGK